MYGLSICGTKLDGLILGSHAAPPSLAHVSSRASCWSSHSPCASSVSASASEMHWSRLGPANSLSHTAIAVQPSPEALDWQDVSMACAVISHGVGSACAATEARDVARVAPRIFTIGFIGALLPALRRS